MIYIPRIMEIGAGIHAILRVYLRNKEAVMLVLPTVRFMNYSVEMGSGAMTYTKFNKNWFRHSEVNEGDTYTHTKECDLIILLLFFQNKECRLKINQLMLVSTGSIIKSGHNGKLDMSRNILGNG
jgi:hypothetical protein